MADVIKLREKSTVPTPKWEKSPEKTASDLRRQIIKAIEAEREVTKHYMTQIGRWWRRLG